MKTKNYLQLQGNESRCEKNRGDPESNWALSWLRGCLCHRSDTTACTFRYSAQHRPAEPKHERCFQRRNKKQGNHTVETTSNETTPRLSHHGGETSVGVETVGPGRCGDVGTCFSNPSLQPPGHKKAMALAPTHHWRQSQITPYSLIGK